MRWIRRAGGCAADGGSGSRPIPGATTAASNARTAAADQAAVKPRVLTRTSPSGGPNARPEVEAERVVAERLAQAAGGREVGDGRERRDEERRLGDTEHEAEGDDQSQGLDEGRREHGRGAQQGAPEQQRPASDRVGQPPGERTQHQER